MLRHTGRKRNFKHNVRLAALLCYTAGMVNTAGLFAFSVLTTNITGHAGLLAQKLATGDFRAARMVALWLILFLAGAFFSSFFIGRTRQNKRTGHTWPIIIEIIILLFAATFGYTFDHSILQTEYFAGSLLFAMGMQNALVSTISGNVVRTTHLTGMFTDLGIELYALISAPTESTAGLRNKIKLHIIIIGFFLAGGIIGGYIWLKFKYFTFYLPAAMLVMTLFYDTFRIRFHKFLRRFKVNENQSTVI